MKTGCFDILIAAYLAEHGVSQSGLKQLARSPAHYRQYVDHPEEPTLHQKIGTIEHFAVFQPDLLESSHWVKPVNYTNKKGETRKWNGNATECKDWLYAHSDRQVISQDNYDAIIGMRDSIMRHPAAMKALDPRGKAEQSLFCEDAETGMQLKCRCDFLSGNCIVDLKKCQDASPAGFGKTVANYWYDLQAAVNLHICNALGLGKENFIFIAVEDQAPFAVGVYQLDEASIAIGYSKFRRLMAKYQACAIANQWPAFSSNIEYLSLPKWAASTEQMKQLLEDSPPVPALEVV